MNKERLNNLAENRRARFDYEILETMEAGLELSGGEVKSVREGRANLAGSYAIIRGGEVWLINAQIPPYQPKNTLDSYDPGRTRRLLLKKSEINKLLGRIGEATLTLVPLRIYIQRNLAKLELALAKSRKAHDKREHIKRRGVQREIRQAKYSK